MRIQLMHKMMLLLLLMAAGQGSFCQLTEDTDSIETRWVLGGRAHYGFVLIHSYALDPVRHPFPWGAKWTLANNSSGNALGIFAIVTRGRVLAHVLGLRQRNPRIWPTAMWYVEPVFLTKHRLNFSMRLSSGLSYRTNPYDSVTNPNNLAYSLRINVPAAVGPALHFRLNPHWNLRLGANFNHVSNGGLALPNKGINYPTMSLGADYAPQGIDFKERAKNMDKSPPKPRLRLYAGMTGTLKRASGADTRQEPVWGVWTQGVYYVGRWSGLDLGIEWINDGARKLECNAKTSPAVTNAGAFSWVINSCSVAWSFPNNWESTSSTNSSSTTLFTNVLASACM